MKNLKALLLVLVGIFIATTFPEQTNSAIDSVKSITSEDVSGLINDSADGVKEFGVSIGLIDMPASEVASATN